ncbi:MAG: fumarylacetoacetate hydrolase family protein [Lautropia sp.]|nr:fumarylacetoacetate hydrolase family protein [Lautropia sp.]
MSTVTHLDIQRVAAGTLFGVALNYRQQLTPLLESFHQPPYREPPAHPVLFIKPRNTRNQHGGHIPMPGNIRLQPGPSLGVVIGKSATRIKASDAAAHILGYTIVNEFSQPEDSYYRPAIKAKCRDGSCPIGPYVVPASHLADPANCHIRLFINGELRQQGNTRDWVRGIAELMESITSFMTLSQGDVLITGTPAGRVDVKPDDEVTVDIEGIGQLTNTVIASQGS